MSSVIFSAENWHLNPQVAGAPIPSDRVVLGLLRINFLETIASRRQFPSRKPCAANIICRVVGVEAGRNAQKSFYKHIIS